MKKRVLFICTHNSARSQIAEGVLAHLYGDQFEAFSAGTSPSSVNPHAIRAMAEIGMDISQHRSKSTTEFKNESFDYIVTVCDSAKEACPFFPGNAIRLHWSLNDPSQAKGDEREIMNVFRKVRDEIKMKIEETFGPIPETRRGKASG